MKIYDLVCVRKNSGVKETLRELDDANVGMDVSGLADADMCGT